MKLTFRSLENCIFESIVVKFCILILRTFTDAFFCRFQTWRFVINVQNYWKDIWRYGLLLKRYFECWMFSLLWDNLWFYICCIFVLEIKFYWEAMLCIIFILQILFSCICFTWTTTMTPISTKLHFMPLRLLGQITGAEIKAGKDIVPSGSINQFFQVNNMN